MQKLKKIPPEAGDYLDILFYEILMLNFENPSLTTKTLDFNANLESFLLHARSLIDFLMGAGQKDDLACGDFVDESGRALSSIPVDVQEDIKEKLNKHLAHITKIRLEDKFLWPRPDMRRAINGSLSVFLNRISASYFPTYRNRSKEDFEKLLV